MPIVKVGDQRIKFPDDMSQEDIGAVLQKQFSQPDPSPQQPALQDPLAGMYEQPQAQSDRPQITGGRGIAGQRTQQAQYDEQQALDTYSQIESGQLSAADLPTEQVEAIRKARINAIPELKGLGANINFAEAMAGMTAFDPAEMGAIISKSDPNIGIVTTPDGETLAVNNKSGAAVNLNKAGPSLTDALQFGAAAAAFTPAGKAASVPGMIAAGMGTQALIETGQEVAGGEFNLGDIALAGAAPVVMSKLIKVGKGAINSVRPPAASQYLDEIGSAADKADTISLDTAKPTKGISAQQSQAINPPKTLEFASRSAARRGLKEGTVEGVGWKAGRRGKLEADVLERDLVKAGVKDKAIVALNRMSSGDKSQGAEMIKKAKAFVQGKVGSEDDLPNRVIGKSMMERYSDVVDFQKKASRDIGSSVRKNANKKLDAESLTDEFMDELEQLKVSFDGASPDFSLSDLANSNTKPIKTIFSRLSASDGSFEDLHKIKQMIYEQVDYGTDPRVSMPISQKGEKTLKNLADKINKRLRGASDDYINANDNFAAAAQAVYPFAKAMGSKFNPQLDSVESLVGQELRKTLSNYNVGPGMKEAITNLDAFARGTGKNYSDDIGNLIILNSELERMGSFKPNSIQGIGEKVSDRAADRMGLTAQVAKGVYNEAKNRVMYEAPSAETLKTLEKMRKLITRQSK